MKWKIKENWGYIVIALYVLVVACYILICGEDIYIQVHDNLDSNIVWYKMLKDHHLFWSQDALVPFLGGVSRNMMPSQMLVYTWLYMIFPTFYAFVIGDVVKVLLAVGGSVYLARSICGDQYYQYRNIVILCGFIYGLMPVFPTSGFAFASLPLALGLLYNLYFENDKRLFAALFFYPFLSRLATFGVFVCGFLLLFFVLDWIGKKKPAWRMLGGVCVLSMGYVLSEYRIFYYMFASNEPSIKFSLIQNYWSFGEAMDMALLVFKESHYHSQSMHQYVIFYVCCMGLLGVNLYYIKSGKALQCIKDKANWIILWIVVNCLLYGFNSYGPLKDLIGMIIPKLRNFSCDRALWLNPFLWGLLFCIILCRLAQKNWRKLSYVLIGLQIVVFIVYAPGYVSYNHFAVNFCNRIYQCTGIELPGTDHKALTYHEFYSEDLFATIKEEIGYAGEPSIAYGMHPAVLNYNTITTLDGYSSVYPQRYKQQFRELLEPELALNEEERVSFDKGGSRAYIYGINYAPTADLGVSEADIHIDSEKFTQMGGKYIFSRVKITNAEELGFNVLGVYQNDASPYTIYVYEK